PKRVPFCTVCSRPTLHASKAELLEWDLEQWRSHRDRSVANGKSASSQVAVRTVAIAPNPGLQVFRRTAAPAKTKKPRPSMPKLRLRLPSVGREPADRVIVLDSDDPFSYIACTVCERDDWILRTGRNEDRTYNYWCVRCSRSFKTDARLRHGMKPFIAAGSVIGTLGVLSVVIR
ncbi:MAG: hypothetical protein ACRDKS_08320, partial [Actinomycetota bacterium]